MKNSDSELEIIPRKALHDIYGENYKVLLKEVKSPLNMRVGGQTIYYSADLISLFKNL